MAQAFSASSDAIRSREPSHSATVDDDFTRLYGNYETNEPEGTVASTERRLFDKMGVIPRHCRSPTRPGDPYLREESCFSELLVSANGRIEGGLYPPSFYEYEDDLIGGTWEDGLDAINAFDWDQTPSEKQIADFEDNGNASDSISVVGRAERAASPSDSMSLDVPLDAQTELDNACREPADENNQDATPDSNTGQMASLLPHDSRDGHATLPLPPSAPSSAYQQTSEYSGSSSPWVESPPKEVNLLPKAQIASVTPPRPEDPLPGTKDSLLTSQASPSYSAGPGSGVVVDNPLGDGCTYTSERNVESNVQVCIISPLPRLDAVVWANILRLRGSKCTAF